MFEGLGVEVAARDGVGRLRYIAENTTVMRFCAMALDMQDCTL